MPKPYPREFRDDVVRVARSREPGTFLKQIATDFGISESCLTGWLKVADIEDGIKPGTAGEDVVENRELRKRIRLLVRRIRLLVRVAVPDLPYTMTMPNDSSLRKIRTGYGSVTSQNIPQRKANSTYAQSRTFTRTGSLVTPSIRGRNPHSRSLR